MAVLEKLELKIDADGGASKVFAGEEEVRIDVPRKTRVRNVPSYVLKLERGSKERCVDATGATVTATDRVRRDRATDTVLPPEPSKKITFRCPGPLLDRLARHTTGPSTAALAALAEFGLNVLLANRLSLTAGRSEYIDLDSLFLTNKREARASDFEAASEKYLAGLHAAAKAAEAAAMKAATAARRAEAAEAKHRAKGAPAKSTAKTRRPSSK